MARSIVSLGMLFAVALSHARRSRGFAFGSPPPRRAATVISLIRRVKILPRFASVAALRCLMFAHLLWPAMVAPDHFLGRGLYRRICRSVATAGLDRKGNASAPTGALRCR